MPTLLPPPFFARYRELPPPVRTPPFQARTPTPRSPEAPPDLPAPVGTPHFGFWRCFARLHPHPCAFSLSSSRPPSTTSLRAFPDAAFPSRRLTVSPSVFLCSPFMIWRPGQPYRQHQLAPAMAPPASPSSPMSHRWPPPLRRWI